MNSINPRANPSNEHVSFRRSNECHDVKFLEGRYTDHVFAPHAHDRYLIGMVTNGAIEVVDPKRSAVVSAGQLVLYNYDQVHWGHAASNEGWTIKSVYISPKYLNALAREVGVKIDGTIGFPEISVDDPATAKLLAKLFESPDIVNEQLELETLLLRLSTIVLSKHADTYIHLPETGAETRAVRRAREYLDANFMQNVSLAELAEDCSISKYWLIKAFKKSVGIAPYEYVSNARVRHAILMLRQGEPVAEVAVTCGFADQSHLTRSFKRSVGVTPGRFRAARV